MTEQRQKTDIREAAARAAREWRETSAEIFAKDHGATRGYESGYLAGFSAAKAEAAANTCGNCGRVNCVVAFPENGACAYWVPR